MVPDGDRARFAGTRPIRAASSRWTGARSAPAGARVRGGTIPDRDRSRLRRRDTRLRGGATAIRTTPGRGSTSEIIESYTRFTSLGLAHSVEAWQRRAAGGRALRGRARRGVLRRVDVSPRHRRLEDRLVALVERLNARGYSCSTRSGSRRTSSSSERSRFPGTNICGCWRSGLRLDCTFLKNVRASSMDRVRLAQRDRGDRGVEALAAVGDHLVGAFQNPNGVDSGQPDVYSKDSPGASVGCLPTTPGPLTSSTCPAPSV